MRRIFLIIPLLFILFPSMTHATTITCSGLPGGSSCDRCDKFDLTTSQGAIQGIVPRSSLLSTEREFVYTDQSSIIAQAHQNAVVTPVGTITSSYTLVGQGTGAGSWNWATLTSASIIRWAIPGNTDYTQPVYSIKYTVKSGVKSDGEIVNGLDVTRVSCVYYYVSASTAINGSLWPKHATTITGTNGTALSSGSTGLCSAGTVTNFAYSTSQKRWSWTCVGSNGGTSINGYAIEQSPIVAINGSLGPKHNTTITSQWWVALNTSSPGLCNTGNVTQFQYRPSEKRWTWTCAGINGGSDARGFASERISVIPNPNPDICRITASDTRGVAPLNVSFLCTGVSGQGHMSVFRDGNRIQNLSGYSRNYEFTRSGDYRVTCYSQNQGSECSVDVNLTGACGNGVRDVSEECDDGNTLNGDRCDRSCRTTLINDGPYCGNGVVERWEQCDDGGNGSKYDECTNFCENTLVDAGPSNALWIGVIAMIFSTAYFVYRRKYTHI